MLGKNQDKDGASSRTDSTFFPGEARYLGTSNEELHLDRCAFKAARQKVRREEMSAGTQPNRLLNLFEENAILPVGRFLVKLGNCGRES
ncbi:MAG: hypothetical protein AAGA26_08770 [Pseudomonadota bacterium]